MGLEKAVERLAGRLSGEPEIKAVGLCGKNKPLPAAGESDIDIFAYCADVPPVAKRVEIYCGLDGSLQNCSYNAVSGGRWGDGDCLLINGVETWVMYYTVREAEAEVDAILNGHYEGRTDGGFYPTGRLQMIREFKVYHDDGFLLSLQRKVSDFPGGFAKKLLDFHIRGLSDEEDLTRAVLKKDVLFYHFALDAALDHFLIALYALNGAFFPSRKRNMEAIASFKLKPEACEKLLADTVLYGGRPESLHLSLETWNKLSVWMVSAACGTV